MKKRIITLVMAAVLAATSLTGCGKLDGSEVVAEVDDAKITANVANFYARYQQSQYETYYASFLGEDMWSSEAEEGKTYEESVKESVLESLETMYVLDAHKDEYEISLTEEETAAIKKAAEDFAEANGLDEKEAVSGDEDTVNKVLSLLTIQEKMREAITKDVDTEVSDEEAAQKSMQYVYFSFTTTDEDGNSTTMDDDAKAELKKKAEAFQKGAASAADFAAYATEQGYEASTTTFDAESQSVSAELITAADALEAGETTEVVESSAGYFVAKVTSLLDREATDSKKETIVEERKQTLFDEACKGWLAQAKVTVHKSVWKKVDFQKQGVTIKDTTTETTTD